MGWDWKLLTTVKFDWPSVLLGDSSMTRHVAETICKRLLTAVTCCRNRRCSVVVSGHVKAMFLSVERESVIDYWIYFYNCLNALQHQNKTIFLYGILCLSLQSLLNPHGKIFILLFHTVFNQMSAAFFLRKLVAHFFLSKMSGSGLIYGVPQFVQFW
jgi:hypothetical protein